jgi:hypothetical protein
LENSPYVDAPGRSPDDGLLKTEVREEVFEQKKAKQAKAKGLTNKRLALC